MVGKDEFGLDEARKLTDSEKQVIGTDIINGIRFYFDHF